MARPRGSAVLMCAAKSGDPETVKLLLDKGADVNARGKYGQTALMEAADWREQLKYIDVQALRSGDSEMHQTALNTALGRSLEVMKFLVLRGPM